MEHVRHRHVDDVNAVIGGFLRDLAMVQTVQAKMFGYKRAAAAMFRLEQPITDLLANGTLPKIAGIGPGSTRVINEVLASGTSTTVEEAVDAAGQRAEIERRRGLRRHFLSRAAVLRVLGERNSGGPSLQDYHGDLQMHSEWSDGAETLTVLAQACRERGYQFAAVTDHSHGLKIAGGMSAAEAVEQRRALDELNANRQGDFRFLQGIEANIGADGSLDLSDTEAEAFDIVLAAPHAKLRSADDQTPRLLNAVRHPRVRILAHPRGRISGSRAGVVAQWGVVFAAAAAGGVAVEIDGDPARQDLDYTLAADALAAGCLFALDSDAHTTGQLAYAETAIAHARLAGIPAHRIVNCWPLDRLLAWIDNPTRERT
jgi:putative hydrolase